MFIGQASSIDGVCMVYGLDPFVHHSNCLYNSTNSRRKKRKRRRNRILTLTIRKRERERQLKKRLIVRRKEN
jgi:hypothetical protein